LKIGTCGSKRVYLAHRQRANRLWIGAGILRDLIYTAWIESAKPVPRVAPIDQPQNPANPKYNPAMGSAPAK
jgi:hypothetical protein